MLTAIILAVLGAVGFGWIAIVILAAGQEAVFCYISALLGAVLVLFISLYAKIERLSVKPNSGNESKALPDTKTDDDKNE